MISGNMSNEDWILTFNWRALLLKSEVGIKRIYYPCIIVGDVLCCQRCFLLARYWWIDSWAECCTGKLEGSLVEVWVHFNLYLLTVPDYFIASKLVSFLSLSNDEYWSCNGSWMCLSDSWNVAFLNSKRFCAQVSNHVALYFLIWDHDWIAISEVLVLPSECPWNLLCWLLHLWKCLVEIKLTALLLLIIVSHSINMVSVMSLILKVLFTFKLTWSHRGQRLLSSCRCESWQSSEGLLGAVR